MDHNKFVPLLGVDIYAMEDYPSVSMAVPIIENNYIEGKKEREEEEKMEDVADKRGEELEVHNNGTYDNEDSYMDDIVHATPCDRYKVFIQPQNVVDFLDHANINLNERSVFQFLLTFPFYEHEWDIPGFVLNALFDDDEEEEEDEEDEEDDTNDGVNALDRFKQFLIHVNGQSFCSPCD